MDWQDWENWLLVDRHRKPSYVATLRRRVEAMTDGGVDWVAFQSGPEAARKAPRAYLAGLASRGRFTMLRACQKALNHVVAYLAERDPAFRDMRKWELAKEPRRRLQPYTPSEVALIAGAAGVGLKGLRQAAMVWLLANCIIRKTELAGLRRADFDPERSTFTLRVALKDGEPGEVLLPRSAWLPGPLQAYLEARDAIAAPHGALWVRVDGLAMTRHGLAGDMHDLRTRSGVKANFNRFRHTRNTIMQEADVPLQAQQIENRHGDPKSTMWYNHGSLQRRRETLARCRVPGYEDEAMGPTVAETWKGVGLPGGGQR